MQGAIVLVSLLYAHVVLGSPFTGFYGSVDDACSGTIAFGMVTVVSLTSTTCGDQPGAFMGTYTWESFSDTSGVMWITVLSSTGLSRTGENGPTPGQTYIFNWNISTGGYLGVQSDMVGDSMYQQLPPTAIDGSWFWEANGTMTQFLNGMFVSFAFDEGVATTAMGNYMLDGENVNGSYAYGASGPGTGFQGQFDLDSTLSFDVYLDATGQEVTLNNGVQQMESIVWEGPWVGSTTFENGPSCVTSVEFRDNFFMATQSACESGAQFDYGFFWGVFTLPGEDSISMQYGYTDVNGQGMGPPPGTYIDYSVDFSTRNGMPAATLTGKNTVVHLTKMIELGSDE